MDIGKDAKKVRARYELVCPVCGKAAVRRENTPTGTAYLHLTKHGTVRHYPAQASERKPAKRKRSADLHN